MAHTGIHENSSLPEPVYRYPDLHLCLCEQTLTSTEKKQLKQKPPYTTNESSYHQPSATYPNDDNNMKLLLLSALKAINIIVVNITLITTKTSTNNDASRLYNV